MILEQTRREHIAEVMSMIDTSLKLIKATEEAIERYPSNADIGNEVIEMERVLIVQWREELLS